MIEIKYRGPLTSGQVQRLRKYLNAKGSVTFSGYEKVIFFDTSIFPQVGDFETGFSRISLKLDTHGAIFRMKEGNPSDAKRRSIRVAIKKGDCGNLVAILRSLGLQDGFYRPCYREEYRYADMVVTIKTECVMDSHFEIQFPDGTDLHDPDMTGLMKRFQLTLWTKKQYQQRIKHFMKKVPAINVVDSGIFSTRPK